MLRRKDDGSDRRRPADALIDVLEPRVLLDATLAWDLSATSTSFESLDALSAMIRSFEDQFDPDEASSLIAQLRDKLDPQEDLFSMQAGQEDTAQQTIQDIFERVRVAALTLVDDYRDNLSELVAGDQADIGNLANTILYPPVWTAQTNAEISDLLNTDGSEDHDYLQIDGELIFARDFIETVETTETYDDVGATQVVTTVVTTTYPVTNAPQTVVTSVSGTPPNGASVDTTTTDTTYSLGPEQSLPTGGFLNFLYDDLNTQGFVATADIWDLQFADDVRAYLGALPIEVGSEDITTTPGTYDLVPTSTAPLSDATLDQLTENLISRMRSEAFSDTVDPGGVGINTLDYVVLNGTVVTDTATNPGSPITFDLAAYYTHVDQITAIIGNGGLLSDDMDARIARFLDAQVFQTGTVSGTDPPDTLTALTLTTETRDFITGVLKASIDRYQQQGISTAEMTALGSLDLVNDVDATGTDFIAFTDVAPGEVRVDVDLPLFDTFLNDLDLDARLAAVLPVDFGFVTSHETLSFTLAASSAGGTAALVMDDLSLTDNALMEFGRPGDRDAGAAGATNDVITYSNLSDMKLGLLNGTLTSIETGHFGVYAVDLDQVSLDIQSVAATDGGGQAAPGLTSTLSGATDLAFRREVEALDSDTQVVWGATSTTPTELIRYNIDARLPLDTDLNAVSFDLTLTQSVTGSALPVDAANAGGRFASTSVEVTTAITDAALASYGIARAPFEAIVPSLFDTTMDTFTEFLSSLGDGLSGVLLSNDLTFGVPLTDIDMADAFAPIAELFGDIPALFGYTPAALGFTDAVTAPAPPTGFSDVPVPESSGDFSYVALAAEVLDVTGAELSDLKIASLAAWGEVTLNIYSAAADGTLTPDIPLTIDLSALPGLNIMGELEDEGAFLAAFVSALATELAAIGWTATETERRINFTATPQPGGQSITKLFAIASVRDRDGNEVAGPSFKDLGLLDAGLRDTKDTNDADTTVLAVDTGAPVDGGAVDLATLDENLLGSLTSVIFRVEVDGVRHDVEVRPPSGSWGSLTPGDRLDTLITQLNAALTQKGLGDLDVARNAAGNGLSFSLAPTATERFVIGVNADSLTRAHDLQGIMSWTAATLGQLTTAAGVSMPELEATVDVATGEFRLTFKDPVQTEVTLVDEAVKLENQSLGGLAGVTLNAGISGTIAAELRLAAGFNILDAQAAYQSAFAPYDANGDKEIDEDRQQAFDNAGGYGAIIRPALLDNTFFDTIALNAVLDAEATEISASAALGMIEIGVGTSQDGTTPVQTNENFLKLNTELDLSLVGRADDTFSDRITATQVMSLFGARQIDRFVYDDPGGNEVTVREPNGDKRLSQPYQPQFDSADPGQLLYYTDDAGDQYVPVRDTDNPAIILEFTRQRDGATFTFNEIAGVRPVFVDAPPGARLADLVGAVDLQGGIAVTKASGTDDGGCLVTTTDDNATPDDTSDDTFAVADFSAAGATAPIDRLTIHNGSDRVDSLDYAMFALNFASPYLDLSGLDFTDTNLSIDTSMSVTVGDLFDPVNTTRLCNDYEQLLCLTLVDPGLIIDSLVGFGTLLEAYSDNLAENFAVLDQDIPLLNESLLDQFDFVTEYMDALERMQAEGDFTFGTINQMFDSVFGPGTVAITFDTGTPGNELCRLLFDIQLEYLADQTIDIPFNLSLESLLGATGLSELLGDGGASALDGVLTSFVDARADAELVIDPLLGMSLSMGLDLDVLKQTLLGDNLDNVNLHPVNAVTDLASVYTITSNGLGSADLRLDWVDPDHDSGTTARFTTLFDFDKIIDDNTSDADPDLTIAELVAAMNSEIDDAIAIIADATLRSELTARDIRIEFDDTQKVFRLIDPLTTQRDDAGVAALFGGPSDVAGTAAAVADPYVVRTLDLTNGFDPESAITFAIKIGDADPIDVSIEAQAGRTKSEFAEALTRALQGTSVSRSAISDTAVIGTTVALSQLFKVDASGLPGQPLKLVTTNFAALQGYDEFAFGVLGNDTSHAIAFTLEDLGNANIATLLGLPAGTDTPGDMTSKVMYERGTNAEPVVYIDTEKTEIGAYLSVGTPDGLNMVVSLGPVEASIENGSAFLGASGGTDRGFIKGLVLDADSHPTDGKFDLFNLVERANAETPDYLSLFGLDVDFETRVELPFSGLFGLLDPAVNKFVYESTMLRTANGDDPTTRAVPASQFANAIAALPPTATTQDRVDALLEFFVGDAEDIYRSVIDPAHVRAALVSTDARPFKGKVVTQAQYDAATPAEQATMQVDTTYYALSAAEQAKGLTFGPHYFDFDFDVDVFDCSDVLELINDPLAIVNGLDMAMSTIQGFVDDYIGAINLPIIGNSLVTGVGFFEDFRADVLGSARAYLETPLGAGAGTRAGELPTTLDLVNVFLNDQMNSVFGTTGTVISMGVIDTNDDHALYGALSFDWEVFSAQLATGFDLGIPGLPLDVAASAPLTLTGNLDIDLGFGIDCNGFFLLNDIDTAEAAFTINATADNFTADMSIQDVLKVSATANDTKGSIANAATGVFTTLGINLFGDTGVDHTSGTEAVTRDYTFTEDNLGALSTGATRDFEKTVYLAAIDFNDFAEFEFDADIMVHLDLTVAFDGVETVPELFADFILEAEFNPLTNGTDLLIKTLEFKEISLEADNLRSIVGLVLDPIESMLKPIKSMVDVIDQKPFSYLLDAFKTAFPIFNVFDQIDSIYATLDQAALDGAICIGTYDFLGYKPEVLLSKFKASEAVFTPCLNVGIDFSYSASVAGPGVIFDFPLLSDPQNALNMLLGKFDKVDLITVDFRLLEAAINMNLTSQLLNDAGLPGWASSAIRNGFSAHVGIDLKAGLGVGYDLSGVVNFASTLDENRLLDGVFIDSGVGSLVDGTFTGGFSLNAGIAGVSGSVTGDIDLGFNDPNSDGKLRIPELLYLVERADAASGLEDKIGAIFNGRMALSAALRLWAGINLPWPLPDLSWSTTVFNGEFFNYSLPNLAPDPRFYDLLGNTAVLNVGARAGANLTSVDFDGNDRVTLTGSGALTGDYYASGLRYTPPVAVPVLHDGTTPINGIIIPAGNGNNTINLGGMTSATSVTVTYAGTGNDTITLPKAGTHIVFAGAGTDTIRTPDYATGTYYIFAEEGADIIDVASSGKIVVLADDDFQMREHFKKTFANGGVTKAAVEAAIETGARFALPDGAATLAQLQTQHTAITQLNAARDVETVTVGGSGTQIVFSGAGRDVISVTSEGAANIYTGAGDDVVRLNLSNGAEAVVEAGAGSDLVEVSSTSADTALVYGWGAQGEAGTLDHLMRSDGDDILIGGAGLDTMFGQMGKDLISGGLGSDVLLGGAQNDIITGGTMILTDAVSGTVIDISATDAFKKLQTRMIAEVTIGEGDGADTVSGGDGGDVLFGGDGQDSLDGGAFADILVGDYGKISVSTNRVAETFVSTGTDRAGGQDTLNGGFGADILVAGGAANVTDIETITDTQGHNIVIGDFGIVEGTRILEVVTAYRSIASGFGGIDNITTGNGNDVIIGGEGNDTIDAGQGTDIVIGDNGSFVPSAGTLNNDVSTGSAVVTNPFANEGDDVIRVGTGAGTDLIDVVLGGGGSDTITTGAGGIALLADYGEIRLDPESLRTLFDFIPQNSVPTDPTRAASYEAQLRQINRIFNEMESVRPDGTLYGPAAQAGDDSLTTAGGTVYAITGAGADTVTLGDGLSYLVTDDGRMTIARTPVNGVVPTFGTVTGLSRSTAGAGDDVVTTSTGRDIILTGDGADHVDAGDGANFVITDNGTLVTSDDPSRQPDRLSAVAGANDGADTYIGGADDDVVGLGAANDTATLGNGSNYVMADSGEITFDQTVPGQVTTTLDAAAYAATNGDGDDTITGGADRDFVMLGRGDDTATLGNGDNFAMGDDGTLSVMIATSGAMSADLRSFASQPMGAKGRDNVTTGTGNDFVVMGQGDDVATLGDGLGFFMGDSGSLTVSQTAAGALTANLASRIGDATNPDGVDVLTTGGDMDFAIMGRGNDTASTGDGTAFFMGDAGEIDVTLSVAGALTAAMTSQAADGTTPDGDDRLTSGADDDFAIMGLGADTATMGDGSAYLSAGDGQLTFARLAGATAFTMTLETLTADLNVQDGNDTVTTGQHVDYVILGLGDDTADLGHGDNRLLGDQGRVSVSPQPDVESVVSKDETLGGNDTVVSGSGHDILVLGQGDENASSGAGRDILVGDNAEVTRTGTAGLHSLRTFTSAGGDDLLDGGSGNDIIIGALGSDDLRAGTGEDFILGDLGDVTFRNVTDVQSLSYTVTNAGAADTITATGAGDNILIGQFGGDLITGGDDDDWIVGDLADMTLTDARVALPGQSAVDRIASVTFLGLALGFDDTLIGGSGADFLLGGFGKDDIRGGTGQDFLFGDTIALTRTYNATTGAEVIEAITNFPYVLGGYDTMNGGTGPDVLIGGLGPDLFYGNTQTKTLIGDAFAGRFEASFTQGFTGLPPERTMTQVNFAGAQPVDLLTNEQIQASNGVAFSLTAFEAALAQSSFASLGYGTVAPETEDQLALFETFFQDERVIDRISQLVYYSADAELIQEEAVRLLQAYLTMYGWNGSQVDYLLLSQLLTRLLDTITAQQDAQAAFNDQVVLDMAG